jgi:hypothetical protein
MPQPAKSWGERPTKKKTTPAAEVDRFVSGAATKRLNVEIPEALHRRVKSGCGAEGREIKDVVIELLEKRFPAK